MNRIEAEALMASEGHPLDLLAALLRRPAWHADALCREHPEISWFPGRGEPLEPARAVCARCPVADECADFADAHYEGGKLAGIWAGMTTTDRKRRHDAAANPLPATQNVVHGTRTAYETGCRCRACVSGHGRRRRLAA